MSAAPHFWDMLFGVETPTSCHPPVQMQLLTKRGKPLLLLPNQPRLAIRALELYPAQTARSRLARMGAHWLLKARLPLGVHSVRVNLPPVDSFVRWLGQLAQVSQDQIPRFAVLAGNPNSPGQRLIILLFDSAGQPVAVVKAGLTATARKLIQQEQQFLESAPRTVPGIPTLRETFANDRLQALALDFLPGRSPVAQDELSLPRVLNQWLHPQQQVTFATTRVGRELASTCAGHPILQSHAKSLHERSCRAAVFHGDFAPWNVRVSPEGKWVALDWERGEANGLPAWDWFHYVVQKSILVQHQTAEALAVTVEALLAGDEFKAYAQASGIVGSERALLLRYLLHHAEVVRPSEGLPVTHDLIQLLTVKWR
jgi:hypothetical protein